MVWKFMSVLHNCEYSLEHNNVGDKGAAALAEALGGNSTVTHIEYVLARPFIFE
jgi:hypothetical protein